MWENIITGVISLLGGGACAFIVALATLKSKRQESKASAEKVQAETDGVEMDNTKKATQMYYEIFVKPIKDELQGVRRECLKLRRAIDAISRCENSANCPVRNELSKGSLDDIKPQK